MTTATAPRFVTQQTTARRIAAGLAVVLTLGLMGALDQIADHEYASALTAQADTAPTHFVLVSAKRLPQA